LTNTCTSNIFIAKDNKHLFLILKLHFISHLVILLLLCFLKSDQHTCIQSL